MQDKIPEGYKRVSHVVGLSKQLCLGKIDKSIIENKQRIGSAVHSAIESYVQGIYQPLLTDELPYFQSFCRWWEVVGAGTQIVALEERYNCAKRRLSGKCDLIAQLPGNALPTLIDFKATAAEDKCFWPLQAQFYRLLAAENGLETSPDVIFLRLCRKGRKPQICRYHLDERHTRLCQTFLEHYDYLANYYDFNNELRDKT